MSALQFGVRLDSLDLILRLVAPTLTFVLGCNQSVCCDYCDLIVPWQELHRFSQGLARVLHWQLEGELPLECFTPIQ